MSKINLDIQSIFSSSAGINAIAYLSISPRSVGKKDLQN